MTDSLNIQNENFFMLFFWAECPPGMTGSPCAACPVDTYKARTGPGGCTPCAEGKTTNGTVGATAVSACGRNPLV